MSLVNYCETIFLVSRVGIYEMIVRAWEVDSKVTFPFESQLIKKSFRTLKLTQVRAIIPWNFEVAPYDGI